MKRFLWLTCLCCTGSLMAACGSSKTKTMTSEDGGVMNVDLSPIDKKITDINTAVDGLTKKTGDLGKSVDTLTSGAKKAADDAKALAGRVGALEMPPVLSCSVTESCIPDGISLVEMGVSDLVKKACEYEVNCCTADELTYKFGPAITTVNDCMQTFTDLINSGFNPNFLNGNAQVINAVVEIAQALNDTQVKVSVDAAAVKACIAFLDKRECNKYTAPTTTDTTPTHCTPSTSTTSSESDPCAVNAIVKGGQKEGEKCLFDTALSACGDGLVCRGTDSTYGICAKPLAKGQRCTGSEQCDKGLFCRASTGQCQPIAGEGDDCAFVDPTFKTGSPSALAIPCMPGLQCDPTSKKCIAACHDGKFCARNGNGADCPDGTICNITEYPGLASQWQEGVCRAPIADGELCTATGKECASGRCAVDSGSGKYKCAAPLKAAGDTCSAAGIDSLCDSGRCGTDLKCAALCAYDAMKGSYSCASGHYCDTAQNTGRPYPNYYWCAPVIANGTACSTSAALGTQTADDSCASGFCNNASPRTCIAKAATGGNCTSGRDVECPSGDFCPTGGAGACAHYVDLNSDCGVTGGGDHACGPGNYCLNDSTVTPVTNQCKKLGAEGDACSSSVAPYTRCDSSAGLSCASDNKCHGAGHYPLGVVCNGNDMLCESGWCSGNGLTATPYACATPLAADADCDTADTTKDTCAEGTYCKFPDGETAGKCTAKGSAGQSCDPRFRGADCLNHSSVTSNGTCTQLSATFMCDGNATATDQVLCHGN